VALLVILGHLYSSDSTVRLYLYSFHMPFFFLVSGVFHKNTGRINLGHYIRTIIWPIVSPVQVGEVAKMSNIENVSF
jgi:fucose 4-O-acetylase-like acetyltransferase